MPVRRNKATFEKVVVYVPLPYVRVAVLVLALLGPWDSSEATGPYPHSRQAVVGCFDLQHRL